MAKNKYVERDKLLKKVRYICKTYGVSTVVIEKLKKAIDDSSCADNNLLALPCNVGDTAYMLTTGGDIRYLTVTHIDIKLRENKTEIICIAEGVVDGNLCKLQIIPSKIGEIYFFNLEDAEKRVKFIKE